LAVGTGLNRLSGGASPWLPAAALVGALLPDIDEPKATVARLPSVASRVVRDALGRGPLRRALMLPIESLARAVEALTVALAGSVKARLGHRGAVHSLAAGLGLTLLVVLALTVAEAPCAPRWVGAAFGLGYLSHLVGDGLTGRGVPLWWPLSTRRVCLGPAALRAFVGRRLC
jgi:hypothetical protein